MRAGFPHSEICGSMLICQLPAAYRRLTRLSSPVIAKASTTCTYSLDPITLSTAVSKSFPSPPAMIAIGTRVCGIASDLNTTLQIQSNPSPGPPQPRPTAHCRFNGLAVCQDLTSSVLLKNVRSLATAPAFGCQLVAFASREPLPDNPLLTTHRVLLS